MQKPGVGHVPDAVEPVALRTSVPGAYRMVATNPKEAIVDFDPDDSTQYLEGVDYPASKEDLASAAEGNGAPEELVERLRTLGRPTFSGPGEVPTSSTPATKAGLEDRVHYLSHGDTYEFEVPTAHSGV